MSGVTIWQQELQQLRETARELSAAMTRAAADLRETGAEPSESLLQQMQQFRADFRRLREGVMEARPEEQPRLLSLEHLSEELRRREEVSAVLTVVNRAAGLRTRTGEAAGPMFDRLHSEIAETRSALETGPSAADVMQLIQSGRHPLVVAMRLAEDADDLTDEDWGQAMETVSSTLGRDLATALARGRLVIGDPVASPAMIHH